MLSDGILRIIVNGKASKLRGKVVFGRVCDAVAGQQADLLCAGGKLHGKKKKKSVPVTQSSWRPIQRTLVYVLMVLEVVIPDKVLSEMRMTKCTSRSSMLT